MKLDGRGQRLEAATKEMVEEEGRKLRDLAFDEEHSGVTMLGQAQADFIKAVTKKGVVLAKSVKDIKSMLGRIDASANKEALKPHREAMADLLGKVQSCTDFVNFILRPVRDLDFALEVAEAEFMILKFRKLMNDN